MDAAREKIVGWYSTGPKLKEADLDINSLMGKFTDGCPEPVMVICEVQVGYSRDGWEEGMVGGKGPG